MTRKEAIEALQASSIKQMSLTKIIVDGKYLSVKEALEMAINALELVTSYEGTINKLTEAISEQEPKWIPVSERLPEEFKSVLVCYKSQGGMAQCVSERLVNMDGSNRWSAMCGQEPIAWMPLPKPYKAESEEV